METPRVDYLASLRLSAPHLSGSFGTLVAAVGLATLSAFLDILPVWAIFRLIDTAISGSLDWPLVANATVLSAVGVIGGFAAMGGALALSHLAAFDTIYRLRLALARRMASLPLGYFATRSSGDAKRLVIDEPEQLETIIAHGVPEGVSATGSWLAVSLWLFAVDWRMALAAIFITPVSFAMLAFATIRGGRRMPAYQQAATRMNASIVEYMAGMPVAKIFNRSDRGLRETEEAVRDYTRIETEWARDYIPLGGTFQTLVLANIVFILPVGLALLHAGSLDLATLLLFIILGANYSQPLVKLFNQFHTIAHISAGATAVQSLLNTAPITDSAAHVALPHHDVAFENVSFGYDERQILHGISFTAATGETTALVGPSGSGKSTIAGLIPRFHDVKEGRITVGGIDIREIGLAQLMDTVAFVFQSTFLFSDTIAANIRFGKPDATDEEVAAAARAARAHDFIVATPDGYGTRLGDRGISLSGGERQRIAIARAILKDAPILVLDEATAFADPDNEAAIQDAIGALARGRTLIVVAHRLHTIANANRILTVDKGRIAENGDHQALLASNGLYAKLWSDYTDTRSILLKPAGGDGDDQP